MPGIVGIISRKRPDECNRAIAAMVESMMHEDFYVSGTHCNPEMGVYGGWVARPESFAARQASCRRSDVTLLFAGECYRDPGVRAKEDRSRQDGDRPFDWLLNLYEDKEDEFLQGLNGSFSGLIVDTREHHAILFNDRFGIERVYWHEASDGFYFASEAKALLRVSPELRTFDMEGVAQFLELGCNVRSKTLFSGVELMPGGSAWSFHEGRCRRRTYFSPESWESQSKLSPDEFESTFTETFKRVVPRYFDTEARIGISLTGGLDSRMIMACRPDTGRKPVCYTFSANDKETLDAQLGARVAHVCGLEHCVVRLDENFFSGFARDADQTVYITDGYFGISGAHEIYLNRKAREISSVRLSGAFGGEILRGVSTFGPIPFSRALIDHEFSKLVPGVSVVTSDDHPVTFAAFKEIPWNIFGSPSVCRSQLDFRTPYLDNDLVALAYRMPDALQGSADPAIHLIERADRRLSAIPSDMGLLGGTNPVLKAFRRLFSKAAFKLDYLNNEGLPHSVSNFDMLFKRITAAVGVVGLHKYLHYRSWFRTKLAPYIQERLEQVVRHPSPFWDRRFLEKLAHAHIMGRKNYVLELNIVLTFEAIERLLFRELPRGLDGVHQKAT